LLNSDSPIPLYHQLAEIITQQIRGGELLPGARIPSEHQLAAAYGIGRPTARQATELLVRKGFLMRRRGSGTFVQAAPKEVDLFSLAGTLSAFEQKGITLHRRMLHKIRLKAVGSEQQNPFAGGPAYYLSRLSRVDDQPVLIEDIYLHPLLFAGIDRFDLAGRSLSRIVADHYHLRPRGGRQHFRICHVNGLRASNLGLAPDSPILAVQRFLHFAAAEDAVYAELYCRTDRFVFSQILGGSTDG